MAGECLVVNVVSRRGVGIRRFITRGCRNFFELLSKMPLSAIIGLTPQSQKRDPQQRSMILRSSVNREFLTRIQATYFAQA
jgi:hypothetical protein